MQYICLIYDDEKVWEGMSDAEQANVLAEYGAFTESIRKGGNMVAGDALQPSATATSGSSPDDPPNQCASWS